VRFSDDDVLGLIGDDMLTSFGEAYDRAKRRWPNRKQVQRGLLVDVRFSSASPKAAARPQIIYLTLGNAEPSMSG